MNAIDAYRAARANALANAKFDMQVEAERRKWAEHYGLTSTNSINVNNTNQGQLAAIESKIDKILERLIRIEHIVEEGPRVVYNNTSPYVIVHQTNKKKCVIDNCISLTDSQFEELMKRIEEK